MCGRREGRRDRCLNIISQYVHIGFIVHVEIH